MKAIRLPWGAPALCVAAASLISLPTEAALAAFEVRAERPSISTFVGIEELNRIIITGADPSDVALKVTHGPGECRILDGEWYWAYKPTADEVGESMIVTFEARRNTLTAPDAARPLKSDFIMSVEDRSWSSQYPYSPLKGRYPAGYVGVPVKMNFKCKDMNGKYHIMIYKGGEYWRDVNEPVFEFTPDRSDVGKKITYEVYYRSSPKAASVLFHDNDFVVEESPFSVSHDNRAMANGFFRLSTWIGTSGAYLVPDSPYLLIKSDGFLADTAYHIKEYDAGLTSELDNGSAFFSRVRRDAADTSLYNTYDYLVKVTKKIRSVGKQSRIRFTVIHPVTGKRCESTVMLASR